ncbi:MAG: transposase [Phycisphaeraceae bacterium]|nr:transposase [Phycisphaeraceae bacterium]
MGSLKRECLNAQRCFSLRQVDYVVQPYVKYHNTIRPHQSLGDVPLNQVGQSPPATPANGDIGAVRRITSLGGLLNHYE